MDDPGKQALLLGRECFRRGEDARAEYFLRQVASRQEGFADVFDMLGVLAFRRGDYQRAEELFRQAVELNGAYTEAQLNLVVTCNELGRYDEARELYADLCARRASASRPLDAFERGRIANLHAQTARAYQEAGQLSAAIEELDKAVSLGPGFADLHVQLGQAWREAGHPERAEQSFRTAVTENPRYVDGYLHLAALLLEARRAAEAVEVLAGLREVDPDNALGALYERRAREALATS